MMRREVTVLQLIDWFLCCFQEGDVYSETSKSTLEHMYVAVRVYAAACSLALVCSVTPSLPPPGIWHLMHSPPHFHRRAYLTLKSVIHSKSYTFKQPFATRAVASEALGLFPLASTLHILFNTIDIADFSRTTASLFGNVSDVYKAIYERPVRELDRFDREAVARSFSDPSLRTIATTQLVQHLQWMGKMRLDITDLEEKFRGSTQLIMSLFVHSPPSPFMGFHLHRIAHDLLRVAMARKFSSDTLSQLEDFERSLEKQSMAILTPGRVRLKRGGVRGAGRAGGKGGGRDRALTAPVSKSGADADDCRVREVWGTVRKASGGSAAAPEIAQRSSGRQGLLGELKAQARERHQKIAVDHVFYNAEDYLAVAPNAIIAQVENIWLQVDPVVDRYKAAAESGNGGARNDSFLHEVLASTEAGVLQISKRRIIWCVNIDENETASPKERKRRRSKQLDSKGEAERELRRMGSYMRLQQNTAPEGKFGRV